MTATAAPQAAMTLPQFDQHLTVSRKANQLKHLTALLYGNTSEIVSEMGQEAHDAILGIAADLSAEIDASFNGTGAFHV